MSEQEEPQTYQFRLDLLGHEIFRVQMGSSSTSDRWVILTLVSIFCVLTLIGAYGEKFVQLVKMMT